jgi:hypothetical protein
MPKLVARCITLLVEYLRLRHLTCQLPEFD